MGTLKNHRIISTARSQRRSLRKCWLTFFNKQRPLKYNEEMRVVYRYTPLLNAAALSNSDGANWPSLPAYAIQTGAGWGPLAPLVTSLRGGHPGQGDSPGGAGGDTQRGRETAAAQLFPASPFIGGERRERCFFFCSIVVTMTLRTSSRENSSWNIWGTKLKRLRFPVRGPL